MKLCYNDCGDYMNYIVNFNPVVISDMNVNYYADLENKVRKKEHLTNQEAMDLLDAINYMVRFKINSNLDNYDNKCDLAVSMLYYYFKNLGCEVFSSMTQNAITNNIIGHSFLTVQLLVDGKIQNYLLDPTYIQFFKKDKCNKNNYFVSPMYKNIVLLTPDPGFFIKNRDIDKAKFLLDHGHILLIEETAEMYGNSFYNTKTGCNYSTIMYQMIPGEVYINAFMHGKESVSKTEEQLIEDKLYIESFEQLSNIAKKR